MNRSFRQLCCLLVFATAVLHAAAQSEEEKKLIAASQAGASPLFFRPDTGDVPLITPGTFFNEQECTVRGGIPNFLAKVHAGKPVTIGYIGGSITQGFYCYRTQSARYINALYPGAEKTWLNAGVSGTGTDLGACRIQDQLLQHQPDLIFVEFAANGAYRPGMEGIIRQIIRHNPQTDICLIYTLLSGQTKVYQEHHIPENIQGLEKIADYYRLPSIHLGMEAAALEKEGRLVWKGNETTANGRIVFSNDGTHPVKEGGNIYAAAIARGFQKMATATAVWQHTLPVAMMADNWEHATMVDPLHIARFDSNWEKKATADQLKQFHGWFPYVMQAAKPGASCTFQFKGDLFGFFDIGGPEAGQVEIDLDGRPAKLQEISTSGYRLYKADSITGKEVLNRFNNYCNNRYRGQYEFIETVPGTHTVTLRIAAAKADKVSILGPKQQEDITAHPEKYDQTVFYLGKILLRGEALPVKPQQPVLTQQEKWEQKVKAYEAKDALHFPKAGGILFTGSSTIENWKTITTDFPDKPIISRGISGTKTTDLLPYISRVVTPYRASQIFLYEGDNDLGFHKAPEAIAKDFETLFHAIRKDNKKAEIIFISVKPSPKRVNDLPAMEQTNALIKAFLATEKHTAYADVYTPMLGADKKIVPAYYREDGLHLTAEGYKIWVDVIRPFLK